MRFAALDQLVEGVQREGRMIFALVDFIEEAGILPRVAGRPGLDDLHHQRVGVAVRADAHDLLHIARGFPLAPQALARAGIEAGAPFFHGNGQGLPVHVGHRQHFFRIIILHHGRNQAVCVKFQIIHCHAGSSSRFRMIRIGMPSASR